MIGSLLCTSHYILLKSNRRRELQHPYPVGNMDQLSRLEEAQIYVSEEDNWLIIVANIDHLMNPSKRVKYMMKSSFQG